MGCLVADVDLAEDFDAAVGEFIGALDAEIYRLLLDSDRLRARRCHTFAGEVLALRGHLMKLRSFAAHVSRVLDRTLAEHGWP